MVFNLKLYYHVVVLLAFTSSAVWQYLNMKEMPRNNWYIIDIMQHPERYFTMWNLVIQFSYFALATIGDISKDKFRKWIIKELKTYIFYPIVVPCSAIVFAVYWSIFIYDRELVFPEEFEYYCTSYSNQIAHSAVLIFPLLELFFMSGSKEVSYRSCFIGQTAIHSMYYTVFFYHFLTEGRFLYPVFEVLTWYQTALFLTFIYTWGLITAKLGITIPKIARKLKPVGFLTPWGDNIKCS